MVAIAGSGLVLLGFLWFMRTQRARGLTGEEHNAPPIQHDGTRTAEPTPVAPARVEQSLAGTQREQPRLPVLNGYVREESGAPIEGAELLWIALEREDLEWEGIWREHEWGPLERSEMATWSDQDGRFAFQDAPAIDPARGSVLLANREGYLAGALDVAGNPASWGTPILVLRPVETFRAFVLTVGGEPAAGASVEQFGLVGQPGDDEAARLGLAARLFHHSSIAGLDGAVELAGFPREQVILASRGNERSAPWKGRVGKDVELRLLASFQVSGQVSLPSWEHLDYEGERRITLAARVGNLFRDLWAIRGVEEGPWGPITVPLLPAELYRLRLEGSPIIPVEECFAPPPPDTNLVIDLVAEFGAHLSFRVVDEDGQLIPEGRARVSWPDDGNPGRWNWAERGPEKDGNVNIWTVPEGSVIYEAWAPGYNSYRSEVRSTTEFLGTIQVIDLAKAGRLLGRCLHRGEPVRDFEVVTWQAVPYDSRRTHAFLDREDGSFEIDDAPAGNTFVLASSPTLPACKPQQVVVSPEGTTQIVLELTDPLTGQGIVVDQENGEGLPEATLQLFMTGDRGAIQRWGLPRPVRPDGSFELAGFVLGANYLIAEAPGYSSKVVSAVAGAHDHVLDWGEIQLARRQRLRIELVVFGSSETPPFDSYLVSAQGPEALQSRAFSRSGEAIYEDVSTGAYSLTIQSPSNRQRTRLSLGLESGATWSFPIRVAGSNRLSVQFAGEPEELERIYWIEARYLSSFGLSTGRGGEFLADGPFIVEGIDAPAVEVSVHDKNLAEIASASGTFSDGRLDLTIPLGDESFRVRVVDGDGQPIPGVRVFVNDPTDPVAAHTGATDEGGESVILGVPRREVVVHLQHSGFGSRYGIRCDASGGRAELELDARSALHLELLDGAERVPGVECAIVDLAERAMVVPATTDEAGRAMFESLAQGACSLSFRKAGYWPVQMDVEVREEEESTIPVQIRELADLEIEVRAPGGLAVSGVELALRSLEFETDVASWIEEGRCESSGLRTDSNGRIGIRGIPRGAYHWTLVLDDGQEVQGEHELVPGSNEPLEVVLSR